MWISLRVYVNSLESLLFNLLSNKLVPFCWIIMYLNSWEFVHILNNATQPKVLNKRLGLLYADISGPISGLKALIIASLIVPLSEALFKI